MTGTVNITNATPEGIKMLWRYMLKIKGCPFKRNIMQDILDRKDKAIIKLLAG